MTVDPSRLQHVSIEHHPGTLTNGPTHRAHTSYQDFQTTRSDLMIVKRKLVSYKMFCENEVTHTSKASDDKDFQATRKDFVTVKRKVVSYNRSCGQDESYFEHIL